MHKCSFIRSVAVLLILCLLSMSLPIYGDAAMPVMKDVAEQDAESRAKPGLPTLDYVRWGENISGTTVKKTIRKGQSLHMQDMGLNPTACANGTVNNSFSWTSSNPSVAAVNAATGKITALEVGVVNIIGTSPFGSQHGQLTLVLFVYDTMTGGAYVADYDRHNEKCSAHSDSWYSIVATYEMLDFKPFEFYSNITANKFMAYMATTRVLCYRGHGTNSTLSLNHYLDSNITISDLSSLPSNAFDYCKFVVYASEYSGRGGVGASNIVNATHSLGVDTVVGFRVKMDCQELTAWTNGFFLELEYDGTSIGDACDYMATALFEFYVPGTFEHQCTTDCRAGCNGYGSWNYYLAGNANVEFDVTN